MGKSGPPPWEKLKNINLRDGVDPNVAYAIAISYGLYKSTDAGESFSKLGNLREDVLNIIQ